MTGVHIRVDPSFKKYLREMRKQNKISSDTKATREIEMMLRNGERSLRKSNGVKF